MSTINMPHMTIEQIREFLDNSKGKMMNVTFIKKDGSERTLNGRTHVTKHLKGGESTIASHKNLYGIFEMNNNYRCFDLNRIKEVKMMGNTYKFNQFN